MEGRITLAWLSIRPSRFMITKSGIIVTCVGIIMVAR